MMQHDDDPQYDELMRVHATLLAWLEGADGELMRVHAALLAWLEGANRVFAAAMDALGLIDASDDIGAVIVRGIDAGIADDAAVLQERIADIADAEPPA